MCLLDRVFGAQNAIDHFAQAKAGGYGFFGLCALHCNRDSQQKLTIFTKMRRNPVSALTDLDLIW